MPISAAQGSAKTRTSILEAARRQFEAFGYSRVTMDDIAQEAGMGKASLYYYFPTKEDLFQTVIIGEHELFVESFRKIVGSDAPAGDKLRQYVEERFRYFDHLQNLHILDWRSAVVTRPVIAEMFDGFAREELKLLRRIFRLGVESGEFRIGSADKVAGAFLHVVRGLRLFRIRSAHGPRVDADEIADLREEQMLVTEIFLRGISRSNHTHGRR